MLIDSRDFSDMWYYLAGEEPGYAQMLRQFKWLGAEKKGDKYYLDLLTVAKFFYRSYKKTIDYRRIDTPIQLLHKALDYAEGSFGHFPDMEQSPEYYYEGYIEEV